jgi:hypothetical protein
LKSRAIEHVRREAKSIKPIFAISTLSLILVSIPQVTLLLTLNFSFSFVIITRQELYVLLLVNCFNSFLNFFVIFLTSVEFRRQVKRIFFCWKKSNLENTVAPMATVMGGLQSSKNVGNSNYQRSGQGRWVNVR